jgi:aminoglycoside phosphotransferase (APT) family kinase protein
MTTASIEGVLAKAVPAWFPGATGILRLVRLSGGASQETWSFDMAHPQGAIGAVLRRSPPGYEAPSRTAGLEAEARLMQLAGAAGIPSPNVRHVLAPDEGIGAGFVMDRVEGETIPRKILRDEEFGKIRPQLARQLGGVLARIHALPKADLPKLRHVTSATEITELEHEYRGYGWPRPVFDFALRWLRSNAPEPAAQMTLVHGDFRNGNFIVGADGLRAVLDWELAHIGDPMEDLGWISVNSWRFGVVDNPVGGFGSREELFAGYEAAGGGLVDPRRVMFWEVLGTLRWGVICCGMLERFRRGQDRSIERAMIGRRASETEIDLLRLLAPRSRG